MEFSSSTSNREIESSIGPSSNSSESERDTESPLVEDYVETSIILQYNNYWLLKLEYTYPTAV